ncbi:hypothetical protein V6N13_026909 [Hibiscus sabdariffa]|uniref:Peptidylprolyl isomerase n=1 Tax=Hibiscus sabdariffa TaxID=183260 RepID=A0ABR2N7T2_9ROSI
MKDNCKYLVFGRLVDNMLMIGNLSSQPEFVTLSSCESLVCSCSAPDAARCCFQCLCCLYRLVYIIIVLYLLEMEEEDERKEEFREDLIRGASD